MAKNADIRRVVKRDGSEQSFDRHRLSESIANALAAGGDHSLLAEQFVETVWVRASNPMGRIESERLAEEVVAVLRLYECTQAADAYAWYRMEESEIKAGLRVFTPSGKDAVSNLWDRARVARSLMRDLYLESSVARSVARRVERRLVAIGSKHLTGRLVSALTENECRTMGLRGGPMHAESLGIERRQLRAWLGGECMPSEVGAPGLPSLGPQGQDARPLLGSELLARFALEEVLSAAQLEAWRAGRFDLLALGDWMRPLRLWLHPEPEESETAFWKRVAEARLRAHEVQVFWPASRAHGSLSVNAPQWLTGPGMHLRFATSSLELAQKWAEAGVWHRIPAHPLLHAERKTALALVALGKTSVQWQPPTRYPLAAELSERRLNQGAAIDLIQAAVEAGPLQVDDFLAQTQESLDLTCGTLAAICDRAKAGEHPRVHLTPSGLPKALDILFPDSALRSVRSRRLILALRDRFERATKKAGLRLEYTCPPHARAAGFRLAERSGIFGPKEHTCGWMPGASSDDMLSMALDTAPWLELPAAALLESHLIVRLSNPPDRRPSAARES
ncbi:MAG: ATP cone domain-containing protein [Planctomycetota bacterium]